MVDKMRQVSQVSGVLLVICTVGGFVEQMWWGFGLLAHLRLQLAIGLAMVIVLWGVIDAEKRGFSSWMALFVLGLGLNVGGMLWGDWVMVNDTAAPQLTITHLNIDAWANNHTRAFAYLRQTESDLLLIQEVTPAIAEQFAAQLPGYTAVLVEALWNTHGSAALLRNEAALTMTAAELLYLPPSSVRPLLHVKGVVAGQTVSFLSLHTTRPRNAGTVAGQAAELAAVAQWSKQQPDALVIIGDFNVTPWTRPFQQLLTNGGLNAVRPRPYSGTYPAGLPSALRLPIDHAVFSDDIVITDYQVDAAVGGDHRPLTIKFRISN